MHIQNKYEVFILLECESSFISQNDGAGIFLLNFKEKYSKNNRSD